MKEHEAHEILGTHPGTSPEARMATHRAKREKIEDLLGRAPTPALKAKYRDNLEALNQAFECLEANETPGDLPLVRPAEVLAPTKAAVTAGPAEAAKPSSQRALWIGVTATIVLAGGGSWAGHTFASNEKDLKQQAEFEMQARIKEALEKERQGQVARNEPAEPGPPQKIVSSVPRPQELRNSTIRQVQEENGKVRLVQEELPDEEAILMLMQASIRAEEVKEFSFDQVIEWSAGKDEIVDGTRYQTGSCSYKAESLLGMKTIDAKALIRNGKVDRWVWPKSGMEIK